MCAGRKGVLDYIANPIMYTASSYSNYVNGPSLVTYADWTIQ